MGKLEEEISEKIKSAITARLIELGIQMDSELPDYVMVLVANKKTQKQMEEDLHLFLGSHTTAFTTWLHNVLKKIEQYSSKGTTKKKEDERKIKSKRRFSEENERENKKLKSTSLNSYIRSITCSDSEDTQQSHLFPSQFEDAKLNDEYFNTIENGNSNDAKDIWDKRRDNSDPYKNPDREIEQEKKTRERIKISWEEENDKNNSNVNGHSRNGSGNEMNGNSGKSTNGRRNENRERSENRERRRGRSRGEERKHTSVLRRGSGGERKEEEDVRGRRSRERRRIPDARELLRRREHSSSSEPSRSRTSRSARERPGKRSSGGGVSPDKPAIPSLVKVTPRPVRPASMQPSCSLILKAVAEAERSLATAKLAHPQPKFEVDSEEERKRGRVLGGKSRSRERSPPVSPRKQVYTKRRSTPRYPRENISVTLLNDRIFSTSTAESQPEEDITCKLESSLKLEPVLEVPEVPRFTISLQSDDNDSLIASDIEIEAVEEISSVIEEGVKAGAAPETGASYIPTGMSPSGLHSVADIAVNSESCQMSEETSPLEDFTVQRFDRSRLGPRIVPDPETVLSCLAPRLSVTKGMSQDAEGRPEEGPRSQTRCKFWPSCDLGDSCRFHHPTSLCRSFPNCKFGLNCLYIHPACKFGDKCLNISCPYVHTSTTPSLQPKPKVTIAPSNNQVCVFYPNCTKPFCPFQHGINPTSLIPCKFGANCLKLGCEFDHSAQLKNPYKWVAPTR